MILQETLTLANGVKIPKLGLGTWEIPEPQAAQAVQDALSIGYRHIDTAQAYGNERSVGEGVRQSGIAREEIFVTTKLAAERKDYESAKAAIEKSLSRLDIGYIDLMIIHSPKPWAEFHSEDRYFQGNREAWRALEEAYEAGKIRAIGVSNFQREDMENVLEVAKVKPMINQILTHITNTPLELIEYCHSLGMVVEAYSPVAHGEMLKNEAIAAMARKYGVSIAQLCIRYCWQMNMVVLPKSTNPEHMRENADLDFVISDEDMEVLQHAELIQSYGRFGGYPVFGGTMHADGTMTPGVVKTRY